jgi:predicted SAM-dependent methyltransferase
MGSGLGAAKRAVVGLIGRARANRWSAPYHDWAARRRTRLALAGLPARGLCVNLGCGHRPLAGFVNVDAARGPAVDVVWDLRQGLPFPGGSCTAIFCEHVIEHIPRESAPALLAECRRALEPGGVLRLSTPDAERYLRSYAGDGEFLRDPRFTEPSDTPLDRVNRMMREGGQHLWVYDEASLRLLLERSGFKTVVRQASGQSLHPRLAHLDAEERAFESLYVEAVG